MIIKSIKLKNFQSYYDLFKDFKGIKLIKEPVGSKINYWLIIAIFSSKKTRDKFSNLLNIPFFLALL